MTLDPHHHIDVHVGKRIRQRRALIKQSQAELAAALGLSFQQVQKYENATNRVSASKLWAIARIQGTTPAWYYEGLDEPGAPKITAAAHAAEQWLVSPEAARLGRLIGRIPPHRRPALITAAEALVH